MHPWIWPSVSPIGDERLRGAGSRSRPRRRMHEGGDACSRVDTHPPSASCLEMTHHDGWVHDNSTSGNRQQCVLAERSSQHRWETSSPPRREPHLQLIDWCRPTLQGVVLLSSALGLAAIPCKDAVTAAYHATTIVPPTMSIEISSPCPIDQHPSPLAAQRPLY